MKSISIESRRKKSEKMLGEKNPMFGKHHTVEVRLRISILNFGSKRSKETRDKMSKSHKGVKRKPFSEKHIINMILSRQNTPSGEKHHLWKGGKSFEPYPVSFNRAFKRFIRDYYGNVCINCGKTPEENGKKLTCHHYDYNKNSNKCVPVCASCNSIANGSRDNGSREFWEDWYTELVNEFFTKI